MKRHQCACGAALFFGNSVCQSCGRALGFDPSSLKLLALETDGPGSLVFRPAAGLHGAHEASERYERCRNGVEFGVCNWLVPAGHAVGYCRACRLNKTIPNLDQPENHERWRRMEEAKRRLIYTLLALRLPIDEGLPQGSPPLRFDFLHDQRTDPTADESFVSTGHFRGLITINAGEADRLFLEQQRRATGQDYRTLLGHFRHESGHFYFDLLVAGSSEAPAFRALFGDERASYGEAMDRFYAQPPADSDARALRERYVSSYASMHPLEDWAETWAHMLHIVDTLETAAELGFAPAFDPRSNDAERVWLDAWMELSVAINELNRSMGVRDAYPFVLSHAVQEKLQFARRTVIRAARPT